MAKQQISIRIDRVTEQQIAELREMDNSTQTDVISRAVERYHQERTDEMAGKVKIKYDGKVIGSVVTNRSHTMEELLRLAGYDPDGKDPYGEPWAWELLETE